MTNPALARVLGEIADLLEIKGENPFKIRAYRSATDLVASCPTRVADLDEAGLRELPGIGKDLARRIREIVETGDTPYRAALLSEFPATLLDLLRLQGVGPKTVARLYRELGIATLEALERAACDGRVRALKGMGPRKEQLILKALDERRRYAGRHLLADTVDRAERLIERLRHEAPGLDLVPVGSLRRGCETCGDLDLLAVGAPRAVMDAFTRLDDVERVLGRGDTKASVQLAGGLQADLRLVAPESRGAALQYFTGSKAHNIALRDRAMARGWRLNEYALSRLDDGATVAADSEAAIYEALGLAWVPPELREGHGEIAAAEVGGLPRLLERGDLKGDVHAHTTATDGRDDLAAMAAAAEAAGLQYLAITDHSQALAMAGGLDERRALEHASRIRALSRRLPHLALLAGIECDIRSDGTLDLGDDCLAELDLVVASIHSGFSQEPAALTDRLLRAIEHPWVDIIGHPTGRLLLRRDPLRFDVERVIDAAASAGVALEINSQPHRLDLGDATARLAIQRGVRLVIGSDAHAGRELGMLRWGVTVARRAWATASDVLNTRPLAEFLGGLRRRRSREAHVH